VIEFKISAEYPFPGRPLSEVTFPPGSLLGAIIRGSRVIIPRGTDSVRIGDRVIVFTLRDAIPAVEAMFA
jgi:trk system potassium uptake protein TrkA